MELIKEINKLREELQNTRHRVHDLESTMGINRQTGKKAQEILERITGARPDPVLLDQLEQAKRTIDEQSQFIYDLQERIRLAPQIDEAAIEMPQELNYEADEKDLSKHRAASEKEIRPKIEPLSPKASSVN